MCLCHLCVCVTSMRGAAGSVSCGASTMLWATMFQFFFHVRNLRRSGFQKQNPKSLRFKTSASWFVESRFFFFEQKKRFSKTKLRDQIKQDKTQVYTVVEKGVGQRDLLESSASSGFVMFKNLKDEVVSHTIHVSLVRLRSRQQQDVAIFLAS